MQSINTLEEIKKLIQKERADAYREGINEGYQVAQRIAIWYQVNHKLKEPETPETLLKWTNNALEELEKKRGTI